MTRTAVIVWKVGKMPQELSRAEVLEVQRAGYRAYLAGLSPKDNPYMRKFAAAEQQEQESEGEAAIRAGRQEAWFRGYAASRTDRARANREAASGGTV